MKLLLIEDDHKVAKLLMMGLRSEGFVIDYVDDGESGSRQACECVYDLIILDYKLPKKMGREVCIDIRLEGKAMPILILSAINDPELKAECLNAGADDFLCKPYSFMELIARIHALLRRTPAITEQALRVGELFLDADRYIVTCAEKEVLLTNKEFMLLEYLMRHADRVVSRGALLENVWDMNMNPHTNTIESHIRSLRRKISEVSDVSLIQTIPGRGYKLSPVEQLG